MKLPIPGVQVFHQSEELAPVDDVGVGGHAISVDEGEVDFFQQSAIQIEHIKAGGAGIFLKSLHENVAICNGECTEAREVIGH